LFKICARTVLELGAELISSDVIAFYELIKNAFDAKSPIGAEIHFEITLRRNSYLRLRQRSVEGSTEIDGLKKDILRALDLSAPVASLDRFRKAIEAAKSFDNLIAALDNAYATENRIIVSDEGTGMSQQDLIDNYLVIGTASRKRAIDAASTSGDASSKRAPFLGEKGIGRLSAMRLGDTLKVETARDDDNQMNVLAINWSAFDDLDAMLEEINIAPEKGDYKPNADWSGTKLIIGSISADWTYDSVKQLGEYDFARLTDPFADTKRRPRIAVYWNGDRIPVLHMDRHLLANAHASVKGQYRLKDGKPTLESIFEAINLGFEHPREVEKHEITTSDLESAICGTSGNVPSSALYDLGAFEFELYWFNRQRLSRIDSIGDQKAVRDLQRKWSGILLFRDDFRVLPYGEDADDWLSLDRRALASTGYLLNKNQFVGRVRISRLGNSRLIDQTNREGLRVCPEQQALIGLLQLVIQRVLRDSLVDMAKRHKDQPLDMADAKTEVQNLEKRASDAFKQIKKLAPESSETLEELQLTFFEIKEFFDRAQRRISEVENENRQMIQMAGVGLLVEVVAHELARSTENALSALEALRGKEVPNQIAGLLETLRSEMKSVSKRVRVLDPLSVSGRQRKEVFDLDTLISEILSSHEVQFKRHGIEPFVILPRHRVRVQAVKGMIIQIIENLISNSIYWLDLRKQSELNFNPQIKIEVDLNPLAVIYEDNGRGIAEENHEKIFRAFFSLKEKSKRRGLGLYIARDCAEFHGGTLVLDKHLNPETGRLHRFLLELPKEILIP